MSLSAFSTHPSTAPLFSVTVSSLGSGPPSGLSLTGAGGGASGLLQEMSINVAGSGLGGLGSQERTAEGSLRGIIVTSVSLVGGVLTPLGWSGLWTVISMLFVLRLRRT